MPAASILEDVFKRVMGEDLSVLHIKPRIQVIEPGRIQRIPKTALDILARTRININDVLALEILYRYGCSINDYRVRVPAGVLEKALKNMPSDVFFYTRIRDRSVVLKEDQIWFGPTLDASDFGDPKNTARQPYLVI